MTSVWQPQRLTGARRSIGCHDQHLYQRHRQHLHANQVSQKTAKTLAMYVHQKGASAIYKLYNVQKESVYSFGFWDPLCSCRPSSDTTYKWEEINATPVILEAFLADTDKKTSGEIWQIFRFRINRPRDLDLWPFNL